MNEDFGVDLDEVHKVIDAADVLIVRFHLLQQRLLIDFRTKAGVTPMVKVVPKADSVEERFRSIKKMRPDLPWPDKVMSFQWPRSLSVLLASGIWQHMVDRASSLGDDETTETCGKVMEELLASERAEVNGAIRGAEHYQTLWERQRA